MHKLAIATAALVFTLAGQAVAQAPEAPPAQALSTANVDFRDAAAVRAFYERVRFTARTVCDSNSANSRVQQLDQACVAKAVTQAIRTTDRPLLTALYDRSPEARASGY